MHHAVLYRRRHRAGLADARIDADGTERVTRLSLSIFTQSPALIERFTKAYLNLLDAFNFSDPLPESVGAFHESQLIQSAPVTLVQVSERFKDGDFAYDVEPSWRFVYLGHLTEQDAYQRAVDSLNDELEKDSEGDPDARIASVEMLRDLYIISVMQLEAR